MILTTDTLHWQVTKNTVTLDCSLDIAVHSADSSTVLLTIPGVDGSLDGYENKYVRIAEAAQQAHGVAVVRMANPFVSSFFWDSNIRHILAYIQDNVESITGSTELPRIKVMAHSAGASILAQIAHEYNNITDILLVNPAEKLGGDAIREGLKKTNAKVTAVFGEKDPSVSFSEALQGDEHRVVILDGVDHNFSGDFIEEFIRLPLEYLF